VSSLPAGQTEGIGWYPRCTVEKYSADQTRWARGWLARGGVSSRALDGSWMRAMFRDPEDGRAYDEGNGVVAAGLANLAALLTGDGYPLEPGRASFGVGSDALPFSSEHAHLAPAAGEGEGRSFYLPMDPGFPRVAGAVTVLGQATFAEMDACFEWREWCWATGGGRPKAGHLLRRVYDEGTSVMMNRKAPPNGFGMKEAGVAWCFRTEISVTG
jgi:hypothetical protein